MGVLVSRYRPSPQYLPASAVAALLAVFSIWCGLRWPLAMIPAALFVLSSAMLCYLVTRPVIEVTESDLRIGSQFIRWADIERIDSTAWTSPLILNIGLRDGRRLRLIHPGDVRSGETLLRQIGRRLRAAMIDGMPYRDYREEAVSAEDEPIQAVSPRYRVLRSEDEAEIEEMYQRLKAMGHLDKQGSREDHHD